MRLMMLMLMLATSACASSCGGAQRAIGAIVDCGAQNRQAVEDLAREMTRAIRGESPNWGAAKRLAISAGVQIGGCALAEVVDWYVGAETLLARPGADEARAVLRDYARDHAGGAVFVLRAK